MELNKDFFIDKDGNKWTAENLQDLVDAMNHLIYFDRVKEHYRGLLLKD